MLQSLASSSIHGSFRRSADFLQQLPNLCWFGEVLHTEMTFFFVCRYARVADRPILYGQLTCNNVASWAALGLPEWLTRRPHSAQLPIHAEIVLESAQQVITSGHSITKVQLDAEEQRRKEAIVKAQGINK